MGVDLVYAIEFKDRRNKGKWSLVNMIVPIEKYGYPRDISSEDNPENKSYYDKYIDLKLDNQLFHYSYEDSTRGIVRDLLSENSWYDTIISSKGFPDDISEELKEKYSDENLQGCWGKSYCTITELYAAYKALLTKALDEYVKSQTDQRFEYLLKRFDRLEQLITEPQNVKTLKSFKAVNKFDSDDDEYNESLWDAIWFGRWIQGLKAIAEFYTRTWFDDDEVRIVYFFG